jgi:hypothetical protein
MQPMLRRKRRGFIYEGHFKEESAVSPESPIGNSAGRLCGSQKRSLWQGSF